MLFKPLIKTNKTQTKSKISFKTKDKRSDTFLLLYPNYTLIVFETKNCLYSCVVLLSHWHQFYICFTFAFLWETKTMETFSLNPVITRSVSLGSVASRMQMKETIHTFSQIYSQIKVTKEFELTLIMNCGTQPEIPSICVWIL